MKYEPLHNFLNDQPADQPVPMTFDEIEELVGALPESAYKWRDQWWANTVTHPQGEAWLRAGRRVIEVDIDARRLVFSTAGGEVETSSPLSETGVVGALNNLASDVFILTWDPNRGGGSLMTTSVRTLRLAYMDIRGKPNGQPGTETAE